MANSVVQRFRQHFELRHMPIGIRLRLVFACVLALMFLGGGIFLWFLHEIRKQVERVSLVEQRMTAVLQIDNGVLNLMNQLYRAAERRQRDAFSAEAARLLGALRSETAWAVPVEAVQALLARVREAGSPGADRFYLESLSGPG